MKKLLISAALAPLFATMTSHAAVILADAFDDVGNAQKVGNTATFGAWDTVNGINAPATSLSFFDGDDGTTAVPFHAATNDGELDVNNNMTAGGWDTSIDFTLDGSSTIDLTSLVLDLRLANGTGGNNNTGSKQGQMIAVLTGNTIGVIGTAGLGGDIAYPSVEYQRTLDLSSFATLSSSTEIYTLTIQARGSGFGHHKSLQSLELNGDLTAIPEPSATALLGLTLMGGLLRRRRA